MSDFSSIGSILKALTRSTPWGQGLERNEVVRRWKEVVGPAVAKMTNPVEVKNRTLYVEVRDSVWLQQMVYVKESVRRALNEAIGEEVLDRVYFRQADGTIRPEGEEDIVQRSEEEERRKRSVTHIPSPVEAEEELTKIQDTEVRHALAALLDSARRAQS